MRGCCQVSGEYALLVEEARLAHHLGVEELARLISPADDDERRLLWQVADRERAKTVGDEVHLRGLIEFSNYCVQNCLYCGLRRGNRKLRRYRLSPEQVVDTAVRAAALGYGTVVLQSGEDPYYTGPILAGIIREIKRRTGEKLAVTLSVGERKRDDYALWREEGADRYLMRHETADPKLYAALHPGQTLTSRLECLATLRELGYQVGAGNMVGLPGQSAKTLAQDLLLLQELDVEMAGIGPFIPHPETPLAACPGGGILETVSVVAAARLLLPLVHLPATTAVGSIHPRGRQMALAAGANVVMPNVTPADRRPLYEIYPNKICVNERAEDCRGCITRIIQAMGRRVAEGPGHSPKPAFCAR